MELSWATTSISFTWEIKSSPAFCQPIHPSQPVSSWLWRWHSLTASTDFLFCSRHYFFSRSRSSKKGKKVRLVKSCLHKWHMGPFLTQESSFRIKPVKKSTVDLDSHKLWHFVQNVWQTPMRQVRGLPPLGLDRMTLQWASWLLGVSLCHVSSEREKSGAQAFHRKLRSLIPRQNELLCWASPGAVTLNGLRMMPGFSADHAQTHVL